MKPYLAPGSCAVVFAVFMASAPAPVQADDSSGSVSHAPMRPYRNADGTFMRLKGTIESQSWSGYAVTAGAPYASASATWQVPNVTYDGGPTPYDYEYVLNWVGVGGYGDATLIQLGTESIVSTSGATFYYAWYELYPAYSNQISLTVNPGDIVTASLQCIAACSPGQTQTWQLTLSDETAKSSWTQSFQYQSSMASAEWITEAPFYNGSVLPLADYGEATYDPVTANGANPNLSLAANGIIAADPYGETSNLSAAVNGDVFSTCWGAKGAALTACTAGAIASASPPPPPPPPPSSPPPPPPPPPPSNVSVTLTAAPATTTAPGQGAKLTWTSANATSCSGSGLTVGNGGAWVTGPFAWALVFPQVTTSYSITCTGAAGSATSMVTVTVK